MRGGEPLARTPSVMAGALASTLLMGFYLTVMSVAQGFDAATGLLQEDWYLMGPLVLGFGVQAGLFIHMRRLHSARGNGPLTAVTGANAGISGLGMLACCVHHLADLLPILGLAGAALFLAEYRQTLLVMGIASNLTGIALMIRSLRRCTSTD